GGQNLAAQFAANGATTARDQHAPAVQQLPNRLCVGLHWFTPQKVFQVHVADLVDAHRAIEQGIDAGDDLSFYSRLVTNLRDFTHRVAGGGGHGDDGAVDAIITHDLGDGLAIAQHRHGVNTYILLAWVVIEAAHWLHIHLRVIL